MKLLLFDIDGTLVNTAGAGKRAMDRTFAALYGIDGVLEGTPLAGRTDRFIVGDAATRLVSPPVIDDAWLDSFREIYCGLLDEELHSERSASKQLLPGIRALLDHLATREDVVLALLTGNFARSARIKLAHFGIWDCFRFGAFGDAHVERNPLFDVAMSTARQAMSSDRDFDAVYVIGDTPHDVACARAGRARALAVATGLHSVEELQACGADVVFDDLADTSRVLDHGLEIGR